MQNDPGEIAERALAMELAECEKCKGHGSLGRTVIEETLIICDYCDGTGRQGGSVAQCGLDGLKELLREAVDNAAACAELETTYQQEHNKEIARNRRDVYEEFATAIAAAIAKMCGEGE